jgi:hypothetical protein
MHDSSVYGLVHSDLGKCLVLLSANAWSCTWGCGQILSLVYGGVGKCFVLYTEYGQMLGPACGGVGNVFFFFQYMGVGKCLVLWSFKRSAEWRPNINCEIWGSKGGIPHSRLPRLEVGPSWKRNIRDNNPCAAMFYSFLNASEHVTTTW